VAKKLKWLVEFSKIMYAAYTELCFCYRNRPW